MRRTLAVAALLGLLACNPATQHAEDGNDAADAESATESSDGETGEPTGWRVSFQAGPQRGAIMSVWGEAPERVFAVGGQPATADEPSLGVAVRWDGSGWSDETLPPDTAMLNWVYGVDGTIWAVGQAGAIVRLDDDGWSAETSPTDRTLWGIWGAAADELWAVGGNGASDEPVMIVRRDQTWELEPVPPLSADPQGLFKVWGRDAGDVWVVGDRGVTLHYDGATWSTHEIADAVDLISVWGSDAEGIVAVGGRANGYVARRIGGTWQAETLGIPGLNGVWVDPAGPVTVVGGQGTILALDSGGFGYAQEESPTPLSLHATFGFSGGPRFAVGGSLLTAPPWTGVILVHE